MSRLNTQFPDKALGWPFLAKQPPGRRGRVRLTSLSVLFCKILYFFTWCLACWILELLRTPVSTGPSILHLLLFYSIFPQRFQLESGIRSSAVPQLLLCTGRWTLESFPQGLQGEGVTQPQRRQPPLWKSCHCHGCTMIATKTCMVTCVGYLSFICHLLSR